MVKQCTRTLARKIRLSAAMMCLPLSMVLAPAASAVPVTADFVSATPENFGPQPLPIFMGCCVNSVRLRFHVPDAAMIGSLNSLNVSVNVYDDGDNQTNEEGEIVFVKQLLAPGNNVVLNTFNAGLAGFNGSTAGAPATVTGALGAGDLGDALDEIKDDGFFLIRVNSRGGDFFLQGGSVTLDATLAAIPEPSTYALMLVGLGVVGWAARRRPRA